MTGTTELRTSRGLFALAVVASVSVWTHSALADDAAERATRPTAKILVLKHRDAQSVREILNLLPVQLAADVETNRLVVLSSTDEIGQVEELVRELDVPIDRTAARREPELKLYRLRHREPDEISKCIRPMLSDRGRISTDPSSRTLLVKDEPAVHADLSIIIRELDVDLDVYRPERGTRAPRVSPTDMRRAPAAIASSQDLSPTVAPRVKLQVKVCEIHRAMIAAFDADDPLFAASPLAIELAGDGRPCGVAEPFDHAAWLHAMAERGALRVIAEPALVVASGGTARFFKKIGKYAPPLVIEDDSDSDAALQVDGLCVDLKLVPVLAGPDRIRLSAAPAFEQRGDDATVEPAPQFISFDVRVGQLVAMRGVATETTERPANKIPLLGQLIRGKRPATQQTELLILIEPEIVTSRDPADVALEPIGDRRN